MSNLFCRLDSDFTVKIADFGLTRNVCGADYYRICQNGKSCKIPVKWVAIESLRDGKFTTNSDVVSYTLHLQNATYHLQIPKDRNPRKVNATVCTISG